MDCDKDQEIKDGYALLRLSGTMTFDQIVQIVKEATASCHGRKIPRLLIDALNAEGFATPTTSQRYWFIAETATAARGAVRLALVVRPEHIDSQRFGVTVAANRNFLAQPFSNEAEALAWLLKSE